MHGAVAVSEVEQRTRQHTIAIWVGIALNLCFIIPLLFVPTWFLGLFGVPLREPTWARFTGLLVLIISCFYVPAAVDLVRYRVIAWLAIVPSRSFGTLFFLTIVFVFEQPKGFLAGALLDGGVGLVTLYFLVRLTAAERAARAGAASTGDRRMGTHALKVAGAIVGLAVALVLGTWLLLFRSVPQPKLLDPLAAFNYGSIGNESAQGLPYWIWRVLPKVFSDHLPYPRNGWSSLGLYWEAGSELPVGLSKKTLGVIPRVSINCAFCHQGSYRLVGEDSSRLIPGGAGTRVSPQAYLRFLERVGKDARFNADRILEEIEAIYDLPWWESILYRFVLVPFTRRALQEQATLYAWTYDRPAWGRGRIDPFNPVKFTLLEQPIDDTIGNSDIMPLWSLAAVAHDGGARSALHWDGLNTSLHEVVLAGAIGDGLSHKAYAEVEERLTLIENWIRLQQPPASPFSPDRPPGDPYYVDPEAVVDGRRVFAKSCAECHDPHGPRHRTVIPVQEMGTDRHRLDMWTEAAKDRYLDYRSGSYDWGFEHFQNVDGYVATALSGVWARGPYLHNGSVPTLWDLLQPVAKRPTRFYRGLDVVDPDKGGFIAHGAEAQRLGTLYDVSEPGNANVGHTWGTELSVADKLALLAYLKTL